MDGTKASGSPLIDQFKSLISCADLSTLRQIAALTSDSINALSNPRTRTPSGDELDKLFKYVPSLPELDSGRTTRSNSSQNADDAVKKLQTELDSLGLSGSTSKVRTKWLVDGNIAKTHKDLRNADDLSNYPAICQLRDAINKLPDCQGAMTGCIVNCYSSGSSRLRPHSDDECYIDQNASICTYSLGDTRTIGIFTKAHRDPQQLKTFDMASGSVFIMQPGSQAATKHKVLPKKADSTGLSNGIRYSISFRNIIPSYMSTPSSADNSDPKKKKTTLIFGSLIVKCLDPERLAGRSGKHVINLAVGGAKVTDVMKHMDSFFTGQHEYFASGETSLEELEITDVIISVGTNDVLNARDRVSGLYIPIQNLLRKAKLLFECKVHFQGLIPIPGQSPESAKAVYLFNETVVKACRSEMCYYIDVLDKFLECRSFSKFFNVYRNGAINIHPNRVGLGILARSYIGIIRAYFDPFSH